jgi:hypothetical protein
MNSSALIKAAVYAVLCALNHSRLLLRDSRFRNWNVEGSMEVLMVDGYCWPEMREINNHDITFQPLKRYQGNQSELCVLCVVSGKA